MELLDVCLLEQSTNSQWIIQEMNLASLSLCEAAQWIHHSTLIPQGLGGGCRWLLGVIPRGGREDPLPTSSSKDAVPGAGWASWALNIPGHPQPCARGSCCNHWVIKVGKDLSDYQAQPKNNFIYLIMLPELGSQRIMGFSGAFLALKNNFLLVLGSVFLFLCPKVLGRTFAWAERSISAGRAGLWLWAQGIVLPKPLCVGKLMNGILPEIYWNIS